MAAKKISKPALVLKAKKLGISAAIIAKLLEMFGPEIVAMLLRVLENKTIDKKANGVLGDSMLKQILLDLLVQNRDTVLSWIQDGEGAIYDAIVAIVSSKAQFLVPLLTKYKDYIISLDDNITAELLDELIKALQNSPA